MASVERRKDGRPGYVVRWRDEAGKQRKRSFAKKALADRYRAEVTHSLNVGAYVDPVAGKATFGDFAERWRTAQPHRYNTVINTRSRLERHVYPVLGGRPIAAIRTSELQGFVSGLALAPNSVRIVWGTVRAILGAAERDRLIGRDPCRGVRLPAIPATQVMPLCAEQVQALADAIAARYRALVIVCAGAGLRQGEAFGLQVRDVDFLRRTIRVDRQILLVGGGATAVAPLKNAASYRTVPVGQVVIDALAAHLADHPAAGEGFIFTDPDGLPLSRRKFNAGAWHQARTLAGVPHAGMHDLRHFFASVLIRGGRSVKSVSDRLGHANAAMTLNVYAHLWPQDDDLDRNAVDDVFAADVPRMRPGKRSSA